MKDEFSKNNLEDSFDYFWPNSDIWTFGCIAYRVLTDLDLFK